LLRQLSVTRFAPRCALHGRPTMQQVPRACCMAHRSYLIQRGHITAREVLQKRQGQRHGHVSWFWHPLISHSRFLTDNRVDEPQSAPQYPGIMPATSASSSQRRDADEDAPLGLPLEREHAARRGAGLATSSASSRRRPWLPLNNFASAHRSPQLPAFRPQNASVQPL
jgi:hypothetical protein